LLAVEDGPLLEWASSEGASPHEAQIAALHQEIVPSRYLRNFEAISFSEQIRLCESRVLVCGCGGLGGVIIQLLARAGVGFLRLVDPDVFVTSNLNRQWMSDITVIGMAKAEVATQRVRSINPFVEVEARTCSLDERNAPRLLQNMHLALDALDNLAARFTLAEGARNLRIPFIHGAVAGWWGQISTFPPLSEHSLEAVYGKRRTRDPAEEAMGVLGPAASVIGSLQAMEAVRVLTGRQPAYAGHLLFFDGETGLFNMLPL
jgi:molybdopterin/thiamine biosynthesis adenylyltransferase